MAKAHQAPDAHYVRNYFIGDTALARLREKSPGLSHLGEEALRNMLDHAVKGAVDGGSVEEIWDEQDRANLVDISENFQCALYALLKQNDRHDSAWKEAVVGIFTHSQGAAIKREGRWTPYANIPKSTGSSSKLGDLPALQTLKLVPPKVTPAPAPTPPPQETRVTPAAPARAETVLVTYDRFDGKRVITEYVKADVSQHLESILADPNVDPRSIEFWGKLPKKIKVEIG